MRLLDKPRALLIVDEKDMECLDIRRETNKWEIFWIIVNYDKIYKSYHEVEAQVIKQDIDLVIYSRNDQIGNGISIGPFTNRLKVGYSSFSGIDNDYRIEEMQVLFTDFMNCDIKLNLDMAQQKKEIIRPSFNRGTFSLIFDTEQLGCIRYGLPRILKILNKYNVHATFFLTNVMKKIYPTIIEDLIARGHEVGIHGLWHESLISREPKIQRDLISFMAKDLDCKILGANLLGRMDKNTIRSLIDNNIKYFCAPIINRYKFLCYPKYNTNPLLVKSDRGNILMNPIHVETYGRPWFSIRNMIDTAITQSSKSNKHITILCHPFRDGNLQHIETTEKMIEYLSINKELTSITADQLPLIADESIKLDDLDNLRNVRKSEILMPKTREDCFYLIPENLMMIYMIWKKNRTIW
jgi:peptidoglycan/xylan/chitin deacetylase (PgdA/CDA1 family)